MWMGQSPCQSDGRHPAKGEDDLLVAKVDGSAEHGVDRSKLPDRYCHSWFEQSCGCGMVAGWQAYRCHDSTRCARHQHDVGLARRTAARPTVRMLGFVCCPQWEMGGATRRTEGQCRSVAFW